MNAETILRSPELREVASSIRNASRNSIVIETEPSTDEESIRRSRFGGRPALPPSIKWPEITLKIPPRSKEFITSRREYLTFAPEDGVISLSFVCQINLEETSKYDIERTLPKSGMLYIFYHPDIYEVDVESSHDAVAHSSMNGDFFHTKTYYPDLEQQCAVIYWDGYKDTLQIRDFPESLPKSPYTQYRNSCEVMKFRTEETLPGGEDGFIADHFNLGKISLNEAELEYYRRSIDEWRGSQQTTMMLGHPDIFSHGPHTPNELFSDLDQGYHKNIQSVIKEAENRRLLIQIDPDLLNKIGIMSRDLFFFIRHTELDVLDFSKAWADSE